MQRVIFHADCNGFYASVELLQYPELRDKPVAVAGSEDNRHGIILAKNEAAKKYKVQTAETVWMAKKKCPDLILLPPHREEYTKYSKIINNIYANYSDMVEPFGIDESWLDMTGSWQLFGKTPEETADRLRTEVKEKTGLTISVGVSFNKIFAKLGSDLKKPDAVTSITKENYKQKVWPLSVSSLLFVGEKVKVVLADLGIKTIGELAAADPEMLVQVLGKQGAQISRYARGEDDSKVSRIGEMEPIKSVGQGLTFKRNLLGYADIRTAVGALADGVASRLRGHKMYASSVQVQIKNPELKSISRQKALGFSSNLAKDITDVAMELIQDNWNLSKPVRMLTITAQNLSDTPFGIQTSLFEEVKNMDPKRESLEKSMDKIRKKYGKAAVLPGAVLHNDIGLKKRARPLEKIKEEEEA